MHVTRNEMPKNLVFLSITMKLSESFGGTKIRIGDLVEAECARTLLAALAQLGAPRGPDPMGFETHACHILLGPANMQQQSKLNASAVHVQVGGGFRARLLHIHPLQTLWLLRFLQTGTASYVYPGLALLA
jgi:hypothetical protein